MNFANLAATRCTCIRRSVGAVIEKNNQILATGYNGVPRGLKHCTEIGCLRDDMKIPSGERHELCRGLHAEQNTLIQAARYGISVDEATIYITFSPCMICAKMLINAGIKRIVYAGEYTDKAAIELLTETKIVLEEFRLG